jgi:hypothetical protein
LELKLRYSTEMLGQKRGESRTWPGDRAYHMVIPISIPGQVPSRVLGSRNVSQNSVLHVAKFQQLIQYSRERYLEQERVQRAQKIRDRANKLRADK